MSTENHGQLSCHPASASVARRGHRRATLSPSGFCLRGPAGPPAGYSLAIRLLPPWPGGATGGLPSCHRLLPPWPGGATGGLLSCHPASASVARRGHRRATLLPSGFCLRGPAGPPAGYSLAIRLLPPWPGGATGGLPSCHPASASVARRGYRRATLLPSGFCLRGPAGGETKRNAGQDSRR